MSKQDRQKFNILIVLLVVLGMTVLLGYRMNQPPTTAAVQVPETKTSTNPPAPTDARIRLDLIEKAEGSKEEIGRKKCFPIPEASGVSAGAFPSFSSWVWRFRVNAAGPTAACSAIGRLATNHKRSFRIRSTAGTATHSAEVSGLCR